MGEPTPGPWQVVGRLEPLAEPIVMIPPLGLDLRLGRGEEALANAYLIAAAPDLFDVAEEWDRLMWREHDCYGPDDCMTCATRAAVAKARGIEVHDLSTEATLYDDEPDDISGAAV